jgi:hypothetical protein
MDGKPRVPPAASPWAIFPRRFAAPSVPLASLSWRQIYPEMDMEMEIEIEG